MIQGAVESPARPRVLLLGEPSARPAGLERALTRGRLPAGRAGRPVRRPGRRRHPHHRERYRPGYPGHLLADSGTGASVRPVSSSSRQAIRTRPPPRCRWVRPTHWRPRSTCPSSAPGCTRGSGTGWTQPGGWTGSSFGRPARRSSSPGSIRTSGCWPWYGAWLGRLT